MFSFLKGRKAKRVASLYERLAALNVDVEDLKRFNPSERALKNLLEGISQIQWVMNGDDFEKHPSPVSFHANEEGPQGEADSSAMGSRRGQLDHND